MQKFINRVSILLAAFCVGVNQWVQGFYGGFAYGASQIGNYDYKVLAASGERFWISHSDPYYAIADYHVFLSWMVLVFILVKLFEKGLVLQLIGIVPLAGAVWSWLLTERVKSSYLPDPEKYIDPLRQLTPYTTFLVIVISVLILVQLFSAGHTLYLRNKKRGEQKSLAH